MKKVILAVSVVFASLIPVASHAAPGEKIAIIDSYFDTSKIAGDIQFVCLAKDKCVKKATPKPGLGTDPVNHGTLMASIARHQNPTAKLVLIQTEEVSIKGSISTLDGSDFINALTWIKANPVSAVSFSYNLTNSNAKVGECKISAQGGSVTGMDTSIRSLVATLKTSNIPVFAAAGNDNRKPLNYPACVPDVISVGSTGLASYHQAGTDILASIVNKDNVNYSLSVAPWFGSLTFTTSFATAAVAANYSIIGTNNKVSILAQ